MNNMIGPDGHIPQESRMETSAERYNCSYHSVLLSLFDYLLSGRADDIQIAQILDNQPVSFLDAFNERHDLELTTEQFMDWIRSHANEHGHDHRLIQMLAPTLRELVTQRSLYHPDGPEITDLETNGIDNVQFSGVFAYMAAIFGVTIRCGAESYMPLVMFETYEELFIPVNTQPDVALLLRQNDPTLAVPHFESHGYAAPDYVSCLQQGNVGYRRLSASMLEMHNLFGGDKDPLISVIKEDINQFLGDAAPAGVSMFHQQRGALYETRLNRLLQAQDVAQVFITLLIEDPDHELLQSVHSQYHLEDGMSYTQLQQEIVNIRTDGLIPIEVLKSIMPDADDAQLQAFVAHVNHMFQTDEQLEVFAQSLQSHYKVNWYNIALDIVTSLTIIGIYFVIQQNRQDVSRYGSDKVEIEDAHAYVRQAVSG